MSLSHSIVPEIRQLETLRNSSLVLYVGKVDFDSVPILYEYLRTIDHVPRLDLLLCTEGGTINAARRLALLLHEHTQNLSILIPYTARSAGTLMSLAAHELVLAPLAEFSPIDPHNQSVQKASLATTPSIISAKDIRAFRDVAENWFGLKENDYRFQIFELLNQRIFPTSLSAFYHHDLQVRQIGQELLRYQLADTDESTLQRIVDYLVNGYYEHNYSITRQEAKQLGLRVKYASAEEETLMWRILKISQQYLEIDTSKDLQVNGLILGSQFTAVHEISWNSLPRASSTDEMATMIENTRWKIL